MKYVPTCGREKNKQLFPGQIAQEKLVFFDFIVTDLDQKTTFSQKNFESQSLHRQENQEKVVFFHPGESCFFFYPGKSCLFSTRKKLFFITQKYFRIFICILLHFQIEISCFHILISLMISLLFSIHCMGNMTVSAQALSKQDFHFQSNDLTSKPWENGLVLKPSIKKLRRFLTCLKFVIPPWPSFPSTFHDIE